jgi:sugar porter (SP) family MFS transporter
LTFIVFRFVGGLGIGIASMTTPMYIAEIAPARLRGRLVALNQLAIVTGIVLVYFVNYFIAQQGDQAWNENVGWRWMFASGMFPSVLFALLLLRIPESPRWLVEAGRVDEARDVLTHVTGSVAAAQEVAGIQQALHQEKGGWRELFSRTLAAPLLLGLALAVLQQVTGINVFLYFGTSIFKSLGSSTGVDAGMLQQIIIGAANAVFTVIAIATVDRLGRKPLMVIGAVGMGVSLVSMGLVAQLGVGGNTWMLAFILLYIACFSLSVGPVTWVILAEIFPTAVRGRALGLATFGLWVADFLVTLTFPILDAPGSWFVKTFKHAFPFYMYAVFCVVLLVVLRFVPETKGRSLEEIERFWKKR